MKAKQIQETLFTLTADIYRIDNNYIYYIMDNNMDTSERGYGGCEGPDAM